LEEKAKKLIDVNVSSQYNRKSLALLRDDTDAEDFYDLYMTKVDIQFGGYSKNVFYKMQILYDQISKIYILFTRWGRIPSSGQFQHTPFQNRDDAVKEFCKIFLQKSGNNWADRAAFVKQPKKYQFIDLKKQQQVFLLTLLFFWNCFCFYYKMIKLIEKIIFKV
jgi:predicted DNA-binding WGR domain protein